MLRSVLCACFFPAAAAACRVQAAEERRKLFLLLLFPFAVFFSGNNITKVLLHSLAQNFSRVDKGDKVHFFPIKPNIHVLPP